MLNFFSPKCINNICKWDDENLIIEGEKCFSEKSLSHLYDAMSSYKLVVKHTTSYYLITVEIVFDLTGESFKKATIVETTSTRKALKAIQNYLKCNDKIVYFL